MATLTVVLEWTALRSERDPLWQSIFCLYAYLDPRDNRILYIGKADRCTLRQRWHGRHKEDLFDYFAREWKTRTFAILQGELVLPDGRRRSSELLHCVEGLLIYRLTPPGNIGSIQSRPIRPGLSVKCVGDWPNKRSGFREN